MIALHRRAYPILFLVLSALGLSLLVAAAPPVAAHPEACLVTDERELDEQCEEEAHKDGGEAADADAPTQIEDGRVAGFDATKNLHALGFSERAVPFTGPGSGAFNSDLAFRGQQVVQGTYTGFRIIDVADPSAPVELVNFQDCVSGSTAGSQGDIVVHGDILVRSWDAPRSTALSCGGVLTPAGQEGVHVFDISDPTRPQALTFVRTPCGSHTASAVPDPDNNRLLIYNSPSSAAAGCLGIDLLQVPLDAPQNASYLRHLPSGQPGTRANLVTVDAPSSAAGTYQATGAGFGPTPSPAGLSGVISVVNASTGSVPSQGCGPLVDFPVGAIALADRGGCGFAVITKNAQNAGASAVIIANNAPGAPITMGGSDASITIPAVMVSQADGSTIKSGLPATGSIRKNPAPALRACHDTGIILGDVLKAACAGGDGVSVWSMHAKDGGSLTDPKLLYSRSFPGVSIGHSAAFTWDGAVLVFGHEPGGGGQPECQATSSEVNRTLFFLDAATGTTVGTFLHPRPQTDKENCTWHNFNVVPTDKRYVLVSGNYQSGISVLDFTNPAAVQEIASADPAPLSKTSLVSGGDWSSYWYNGRIYQSDMRRGLLIWNLSDPAVAGAKRLDSSNPQTAETSFPLAVRPSTKRG